MSTPLQLTILRQGDTLLIDLAEVGSLIPRSEVHVDEGFVHDLTTELETLGNAGVTGRGAPTRRNLERIGGLIFSHLLTDPARDHLRRAPAGPLYLRLDEELLQVPWELCHDGEHFVASRFQVGRQVITGRSLPPAEAAGAAGDVLRVLLVADPTETLPQVAVEAERLCELLDAVPNVDVTLLGGRSVRRIPLLAALGEHDVVHFAGHSHHDAAHPERSGWRLHEGLLTAGELSRIRPAPALVFSNSCEAGAGSEWSRQTGFDSRAFGIGSAFLLAGVRNYIGTFWVVHDEESARFATTCYRSLASGGSLGAALQAARVDALERHGPDGLTWASYLLYGDPAFVPFPADTPRPGVAPRTEVTPTTPAHAPVRYAVDLTPGETEPKLHVERAASPPLLVGRTDEQHRLEAVVHTAGTGARQTVFVSGPAGIGKTTLVDALRAGLTEAGVWIAEGQSVQQYGAGEAYLPFLEALGRLAHTHGGLVTDVMRRIAPTWLAQLPALLAADELDQLRRRAVGVTQERMLREMAELIEALAVERTLVLILEDLHWADPSSVTLVGYLAQRRGAARLLLVGTYRKSEVMENDHHLRPIVQELTARGQCERIELDPLGERDVARYLEERLVGGPIDESLAPIVHRRTEGHPLFLTNVVDFALREGLIVEEKGRWEAREGLEGSGSEVPDELRQLIERQLDALEPADRALLEAASVVGSEFAVAEAAAALDEPEVDLERRCEALAWRGRFLREAGVAAWPDGTTSGRYRFLHALYVEVLYGALAPARRSRLHAKIAGRKETAYAGQIDEVAGELATHFEAAGDPVRAVRHHELAADLAMVRHASHEAQAHLEQALRLVPELPPGPTTSRRELDLLVKLSAPVTSTVGWAAPEIGPALQRARELAREVEEGPHLFPLLRNLISWHQVRAEAPIAREIGDELLLLAANRGDEIAAVQAHYGQGVTLYPLAEFTQAERHLWAALDLYDPATHLQHVSIYGDYDPGVSCLCWISWVEWMQGKLDRAMVTARSSLDVAQPLEHPFTHAWAHLATAIMHLNRGEVEPALEPLEISNRIAREEGFLSSIANAMSVQAWALLLMGRAEDARKLAREAIAALEPTGTRAHVPRFFLSLAITESILGRHDEALRLLDQAIDDAESSSQLVQLPTLYRARGGMRLGAAGGQADGADDLERSLALARKFQSPLLVLQAVRALVPLRTEQGREDDARRELTDALAGVDGGETTSDVRSAKAALAKLDAS